MIEIVTLMLGLVIGLTEVELNVGPQVSRVEVRIDNEAWTEVDGPPWAFQVDWGQEILPRELTVIAFDDKGQELDRDQRWVNLQSRNAAAKLVFPAADRNGRVSHADVRWASVGTAVPRSMTAVFDEKPVTVSRQGRIRLPKYDPAEFHWLSVEVDFDGRGSQTLGAVLGGETLVELATELTALPVTTGPGRTASEWAGKISVDGRPASIHGVEKGAAEVVAVVDRPAASRLGRLMDSFSSGRVERLLAGRRKSKRGLQISRNEELANFGKLGRRTSVRFLWPRADVWPGHRLDLEMFTAAPRRPLKNSGLMAAVHRDRGFEPETVDELSSAVALAGLAAAGSSKRRAVVLMAGDLSTEGAEQVARTLRFLKVLRVPLYVWSVGDDVDPGSWPVSHRLGDPEVTATRVKINLRKALEQLRRDLGQQRIVWLEGRHLPQAISLSQGLQEVGTPSAR